MPGIGDHTSLNNRDSIVVVESSNFGVDLEHIAFGIGKVHGSVSPGLVSWRVQDFYALVDELVVAQIDLGWRHQKSNLHTG